MPKLINPKIFNAFKHGVSSRHGLLPWEKAADYASLEAKWRRELQPHGAVLEDLFAGIVRNRWLRERNSQAMAIFVTCHPFGRAVADAAGAGDWVEAARKHLGDLNAGLITLVQTAELLKKQAAASENTSVGKQRSKAAEKWADGAPRIAAQYEQAMAFFLGLGDEIKKQADRDTELDGKFHKLLTSYFQVEQMLATREKLLPQLSRQSSADDHDDFADELPENPAPKDVRPIAEKKALPDPAKDAFDDNDWDTPSKH
jgi:hypothetical protein